MKPAYLVIEYLSHDGESPEPEWLKYADVLVDLDAIGMLKDLEELGERLEGAKLHERVRVRADERQFAPFHAVSQLVDHCLMDQHLGWPTANLDQIELRELKRTVTNQGRALDRILALLEGCAQPAAVVGAQVPHMARPPGVPVTFPAAPERVVISDELAASMVQAEVIAPAPRAAAEPPLEFEIDESTTPPPIMDGQLQPLVPVITASGNTEQVGAGARGNVRSRGFGIGGPSAKSEVERIGPNGKEMVKVDLPRVGDTLKHKTTSNEYEA